MRKTRLTRKASLTRTAPLPRSGIKRRGRKASEFARIYGSKARVEWVKQLGCVICGALPSDNAHTVGGGVGYKAGYEVIVPLCRAHHSDYDEHRLTERMRAFVLSCAPTIERLWQHRQHPQPEHISGPLGRVLTRLLDDE